MKYLIPIGSKQVLYIDGFIHFIGWEMLGNNICYGARRGVYGTFRIRHEGFLFAIKLEHVSGYLTCDRGKRSYASNWGCHSDGDRNGKCFMVYRVMCCHNIVLFNMTVHH